MIHFELIMKGEISERSKPCVQIFFFFNIWVYISSSTIFWKEYLFIFSPLNCFHSFGKDQLTLCRCVYFGALHCVTLIYLSILPPVPHCLDYCIIILSLKVEQCQSSMFSFSFLPLLVFLLLLLHLLHLLLLLLLLLWQLCYNWLLVPGGFVVVIIVVNSLIFSRQRIMYL